MAYRRAPNRTAGRSSRRKLELTKVLPIWTSVNTDTNNIMFLSCLEALGITDLRSYWLKLRILIVISVFVLACIGASTDGIKGLLVGSLLGFATPAALIWLGVTLIHIAIYLAIYCAAWAVILCVAWWFFSGIFGG